MKIKMRSLMCGPFGVRQIGEVCTVPEDEGTELVLRGFASEIVAPQKKPAPPVYETAAITQPEKRGRKK